MADRVADEGLGKAKPSRLMGRKGRKGGLMAELRGGADSAP